MKTDNWIKIEKEFVKWDEKGGFNASQRDILNWFKKKFDKEQAKAHNEGVKEGLPSKEDLEEIEIEIMRNRTL